MPKASTSSSEAAQSPVRKCSGRAGRHSRCHWRRRTTATTPNTTEVSSVAVPTSPM